MSKAILALQAKGKVNDKHFSELEKLAETAGYEVVAKTYQRRDKPDKAFCVGKGKVDELKAMATALEAETIIFDNDISGTQFNNLEKVLELSVIDRRTLILEIFANRAKTNEGKLQVELAQKKNALPRLMGKGFVLSRQGGGGGGGGGARRGGGEQQLELDRRTIRKEIADLEEKIKKLTAERALRRTRREKSGVKVVAVVGYTNAGKSTLMNTVTKAGVLEEDKLFATLDPISRRLFLNGTEVLITDTVGFISRLPHTFIDAFRSTLEEVKFADLILHVVDGSSESALTEYDVVESVLKNDLKITETPIITVMNKADKGEINSFPSVENLVVISAKTGMGVENLKEMIAKVLLNSAHSAQRTMIDSKYHY
ncbi:MAG: GTPase HflX [Firmicutes bacterium]|nr:GTPase HflX [Bacillota bacterium]